MTEAVLRDPSHVFHVYERAVRTVHLKTEYQRWSTWTKLPGSALSVQFDANRDRASIERVYTTAKSLLSSLGTSRESVKLDRKRQLC